MSQSARAHQERLIRNGARDESAALRFVVVVADPDPCPDTCGTSADMRPCPAADNDERERDETWDGVFSKHGSSSVQLPGQTSGRP